MPEYSVSSMFFHEYTCAEIFTFAGKAGCSALEFWPETPDFWLNGKDEESVKNLIVKHPSIKSLTVHAPVLDLNPCSVNPDVAEVSIKNTIEAIGLAKDLDAAVVTIHPGRRTAKRPAGKRDMERFGRYIARVRDASEGTGVRVALENMAPKVNALFSRPEEMKDLLENEDWLYFTFDIAHATIKDDANVMKFIEPLFERIINVHVSRNSGAGSHFPVGEDPGTGRILSDLHDAGYNNFLTLEIEDLNFGSSITAEEKISVIGRDLEFIRSIFG